MITNCLICGCPNDQHTSNGFISWCENDDCPGRKPGEPCITDSETGETLEAVRV